MSRVIITGATGVGASQIPIPLSSESTLLYLFVSPAGLAIYRAALNDPAISKVTLLTRRAMPSWAKLPPNADEKTEVILHSDFKTYPPDLARRLAEHDGVVWALGKSSHGMSEEAYTELTYEYTMAAARAIKEAGAGSPERPFRFVYISGELADPTGKSMQMWARVKVRVFSCRSFVSQREVEGR